MFRRILPCIQRFAEFLQRHIGLQIYIRFIKFQENWEKLF